jgi:hypothetical protein
MTNDTRNPDGGLVIAAPGGYEQDWGALVGAGTSRGVIVDGEGPLQREPPNRALKPHPSRLRDSPQTGRPIPCWHCGGVLATCITVGDDSYHGEVLRRQLRELARESRRNGRWVQMAKGQVWVGGQR